MGLKIGFPKTLFYYLYYPFWYSFFTVLGFEVITSHSTNKNNLDLGIKEAVNDACLPIKLYHGHVAELKDKVDFLFLPRLVSVRRLAGETFCPKFLGLPDMIKNSIEDLPKIIDERIDLSRGTFPLWKLCRKIAKDLNKSGPIIWKAFFKAKGVQERFLKLMLQGIPAQNAIDLAIKGTPYQVPSELKPDLNLAILGYPYVIYDSYINVGLLEKLLEMGIKPWTVEMIPERKLDFYEKYLPKNLFWHFSNRTVRATFYYLNEQKVDGIVHVTAFGCGPDAMVDKLMELEAKNSNRTPFLTLSLDEHTGEAGVLTRIEAFVDMLRLRRSQDENFLSNHG